MSTQKFAIVSHIVPPSYSGQAVMLYRLLKNFDPNDFLVIASSDQAKNAISTKTLSSQHVILAPHKRLGPIFGFPLLKTFNFLRAISHRSSELIRILNKYPSIGTLVVCTGDFIDLPACYLCAKRTKTELVCYLFDDYAAQWTGFMGFLARKISKPIFKFSKSLIVPNEFLADKYRSLNKKTLIVRNPINLTGDMEKVKFQKDKFNIIYTGAIYEAHFSAFRNLISCIKKIPDARLHLYTAQPKKDLYRSNILTDQVTYHSHLNEEGVASVLAAADLLFLPLAFDSPYPEVIRTSAPGKMGEYLQSGRPIIVHAPKNSFVSHFFRKNCCGIVVDEQSEQLLLEAIEKIRKDKATMKKIQKNSLEAAQDFSIERNVARFKKALE